MRYSRLTWIWIRNTKTRHLNRNIRRAKKKETYETSIVITRLCFQVGNQVTRRRRCQRDGQWRSTNRSKGR